MSRTINFTSMERRERKIRAKLSGTKDAPRLTVFKSNKFIYAQIINDDEGKTLAASSSVGMKAKSKVEQAKEVGTNIAKKALEAGITKVVFDRSGYLYAGKIKTLADAAREAGLKF
ncbi:MAG: 50S ribosomal protein L18 [Candidatus Taylorbacteria bacterium]|nr:50S ribosomal protein L18 [Candidatus Taylorbacteria bacterium]